MKGACPNTNLREWKLLANAIGIPEAMRDWMENDGNIRSIAEVRKEKPQLFDHNLKTVFQGYNSFEQREFNYFTVSKDEASNYGSNVRQARVDTTEFLRRAPGNNDLYWEEVAAFKEVTGKTFDILDNSREGLTTQNEFFRYLMEKGYKGLDLTAFPDSAYLVEFTNYQISSGINLFYQLPDGRNAEEYIASEKTIRDLAAIMSDRIGIPVRFESNQTEKYKGRLEDYQGNIAAVINLAYATLDTPIHEILGHPIIRAIRSNIKLPEIIVVNNITGEISTFNSRSEANDFIDNNGLDNSVIIEGKYIPFLRKADDEYQDQNEFTGYYTAFNNFQWTTKINPKDHQSLEYISDAAFANIQNLKVNSLYKNLLKELETGKGKEVLDRIKRDYKYKNSSIEFPVYDFESEQEAKEAGAIFDRITEDGESVWTKQDEYTLEEQQEEAIVELLGLYTADRLDKVKDGKLISLLKRLFKEIKAFVRDLLKQREVEIDKLPDNMTLGDIADLLAYSNSKLILPGNEVIYTTPDNQQFKTYAEASKHISDLVKSVEDVDLSENISIENIDKQINDLQKELDNFKFEIEPFNKFADIYTTKGRLRQNYWARRKDGTAWWTNEGKETLIEPEYDGFVLDLSRGTGRFITKISDKEAEELYYSEGNKFNTATQASREKYSELESKLHNLKNNSLKAFIEKNKKYEQSKEIIEEWKKVNNIQYNPEEVYSRGQGFYSAFAAYSDLDLDTLMANILHHIEDNEKAGGKFALSAFTKPFNKTIRHIEKSGLNFVIFPKPEHIMWAANTDVYSGSVWDASQKINPYKKSELLGVSYTKYPLLSNVEFVQPNLASIIDNLSHHHNELGIQLTGNNFRFEINKEVLNETDGKEYYKIKAWVDKINSILDQKYGKLVKPEITLKDPKQQFSVYDTFGAYDLESSIFIKTFNTFEEAQKFADLKNSDEGYTDSYEARYKVVKTKRGGIQPTQTDKTLKESIKSVENRVLKKSFIEHEVINTDRINFLNSKQSDNKYEDSGGKYEKIANRWFKVKAFEQEQILPEYASQAIINTKVAKLKEVAKKYPRSLIRSEVVSYKDRISNTFTNVEDVTEDWPELPFQKIPSREDLISDNAPEIISALISRLQSQHGVNAHIISKEEAIEILGRHNTSWNNEPAFSIGNEVYFIRGMVNSEMVFHEFGHPVIQALENSNPDLFNNLYESLVGTTEGQELLDLIRNKYPELQEGTSGFKREMITQALGKRADQINANQNGSTGFIAFIKELLFQLKRFLRSLFKNKIAIEKLSPNTTLEELANMLANEEFNIMPEKITEADLVEFYRDTKEQIEDNLKKMERSHLRNMVLMFGKDMRSQLERINAMQDDNLNTILRDKLGRQDLSEIIQSLKPFSTVNKPTFENIQQEFNYYQNMVENFVNTLMRLEEISEKIKDEYKRLSQEENIDDPLLVTKLFYYNRLIKEWEGMVTAVHDMTSTAYDDKIPAASELFNMLNATLTNFKKAKDYGKIIMMSAAKDLYTEQLATIGKNIDDFYTEIIEFKRRTGALPKHIERLERDYEAIKINPDKIEALLKGELGDAHPLNAFIEGYMYNQDPLVFGLAQFVKDNYIEEAGRIQQNFNEFINEVDNLLDAAGYTTNAKRILLYKDITTVDERRYNGENPATSYRVFLTPYKNYRSKIEELESKVSTAKMNYEDKQTDESFREYAQALDVLRKEQINYWHQQYAPEFYARYELFNRVEEINGEMVPVGQYAYAEQMSVLNKIHHLNSGARSFEDLSLTKNQENDYWREYAMLASETYANGTPKTGIELAKAKLLQEYRTETRKFYEWKPKTGVFNTEYLKYMEYLMEAYPDDTDPAINTANRSQRDELMQKWIKDNTSIAYSQSYYDKIAEIFTKLNELPSNPEQSRLTELYKERLAIINPYRDTNKHPIGSMIGIERQKKLKEIDEEIDQIYKKLKNSAGLTEDQYEDYLELDQKYQIWLKNSAKDEFALTEEEETRYNNYLAIRSRARKNPSADDQRRKELFQELRELRESGVPTQDYFDTINNSSFMTAEMRAIIKRFGGTESIDEYNYARTDLINALKKESPEFKAWHERNHIVKTGRKNKKSYKPTSAWVYAKPKEASNFESTVIYDRDGTTILTTIEGRVPSRKYFYRTVKKTVDGVNVATERITYLDAINAGRSLEEATIDMKGNWLPRMVPNSPYINGDYQRLKAEPKKHAVLIAILKNHLRYQQNLPYGSRLDIEIPRFRRQNFESIIDSSKVNPVVAWIRNVRAFFSSNAPDDMERGLNPSEEFTVVNADLFDSDYTRIPINGIYDMPLEETSDDVLRGVMRYMQSAERQKTLFKMLPTVKTIQAIVNDPDNNPDLIKNNMKVYKRNIMKAVQDMTPLKQKGVSVRAKAINNFIQREFEGITQVGLGADYTPIQKIANQVMRVTSFAFFGFNIPSALKNSMGARFQSLIESAGGGQYNAIDYARGSSWAAKSMMEISMQIYKTKGKSLDVQLIEMMDPTNGRFVQQLREGSGTTRSRGTDLFDDFKYAFNIRRWTELNANLSIFGAMLKKTLVEQTLPNGEVRKLTYDQAWELRDGVIQLKEGINPEWGKSGKKYKQFIRAVQGISNNLNGAYSNFDQPEANRYLLWRMVMFIKTYFMRMFMNRFQSNIKKGFKFLPRYDAYLDNASKGFYVNAFRAMVDWIQILLTSGRFASMHKSELADVKKMGTEFGMLIILSEIIIEMFFDFDEDDEDKYAKLREKSGPIFQGMFGIAEDEHEFNLGGWTSNHLLSLAMQVRAENEAWIPWPKWGLDEYVGILSMDAIPMKSTVSNFVTFLAQTLNAMQGDPKARYQREVGPYDWQQEEALKLNNYLLKSIGLTGKAIDPVGQIVTGLNIRNSDVLGR